MKKTINWILRLWPLMSKEEFFKIILGSLIVGLFGLHLNADFQNESWERQVKFELVKNEIQESRDITTQMTSLIEERRFNAQRFIWAINDGKTENADEVWSLYMKSVAEWNKKDTITQTKLAQMYGYEIADQFLSDTSDGGTTSPKSVHYKFKQLHDSLLYLKECRVSCNKQRELIKASKYIEAIIEQETTLISELNELTSKKYNNLKLSPSTYLNGNN